MTGLGRPQLGVWLAACCLLWVTPVYSQFGPAFNLPNPTPEKSLFDRLHHESRIIDAIQQAEAEIESQKYDDAIESLQTLLESTEDFFDIEPATLEARGSLLDRIESILRKLPAEAQEGYRRQYESQAEQLLMQAQQSRQLDDYLETARRYPLTLAAQLALREAAGLASDHGETAIAARLRERLLLDTPTGPIRTTLLIEIARDWTQAGQPKLAESVVQELSALARSGPIEFEGKLLTPPATADAAWLNKVFGPVSTAAPQRSTDWRISGGHPRHWADGEMVSLVERGAWSYSLIDQYDTRHYEDLPAGGQPANQKRYEKLQVQVKGLESRILNNRASGLPVPLVIGSPLVDGGTALMQGMGTVKAVDAQTGKLRWSGVVEDNTFLYWVYHCLPEDPGQNGLLDLFLGQRIWANQTAASLASDGQRVYAITGTGMVGVNRNIFVPGRGMMPRSELTPSNENRLLAYDIETGLLKWELGGAAASESFSEPDPEQNSRMTGAFFLGAPLAVEGRLYVMAEDRSEVRLLSLIPETGAVEWSVPLVNPDKSVEQDEIRRIVGLTPSYAGGLLICPTAEGIVVAVDPLRQRVKWVHQYRVRPRQVLMRGGFRMQQRDRFGVNQNALLDRLLRERRWIDATPLVHGGRVLLPAVDSHELICLDAETGQVYWKIPRGDGLYLATCTSRHCLIAGERSIQSVRIFSQDGSTAWSREIPAPAGRGVLARGNYLLPASTGEILAIDIEKGNTVGRIALNAGQSMGTLIAAGDQLLMQTPSEVIGFRNLSQVHAELATQLHQPESRALALADQGILHLSQGREADGIAALRESLQLQDSETTRKALVWPLLERLKSNYTANRSLVPELKQMVRDPAQRKLLARVNAEGLEQSGEVLEAFREYLQLVPEVRDENTVELGADSYSLVVREDRWLRGRLVQLYQTAPLPQREQMQQILSASASALPIRERIDFARLVGIELAPNLFLELALEKALDDFLTARVLWTLSESADIQQRGLAIARLVRLDLASAVGVKSNVARLIPRLDHEFADVEVEPGLKGSAFLKSIREDAKLAKALAALEPAGVPQVEPVNDLTASAVLSRREIIPVLGPRRGVFDEWLFSWEQRGSGTFWCSDAMGRDRSMPQTGGIHDQLARYVQTDAQLALLVFRDQFAIISPMDPSAQPRFEQLTMQPGFNGLRGNLGFKPGVRDKLYTSINGGYAGNVGPLQFDTLVYQLQDGRETGDLIAINPQLRNRGTQPLWKRTGLPVGCEILADGEYVVVIPPTQDKLYVLRAADGRQIAERRMPPRCVERQRAEWGRLFLTKPMTAAGDASPENYSMYDPVQDQPVWSRTVPMGSLWVPVNGDQLLFVEPGGQATLIQGQSGAELWTTKLPDPASPSQQLRVHLDRDQLYVHLYQGDTTNITSPQDGQVVALDRQSGAIQWSRPIEKQVFREGLPVGTGLLVYGANLQKRNGEIPVSYSKLEFLDRKTGKTVFENELGTGVTQTTWKTLPSGVLRIRVIGHDFDLTWKQAAGTPAQSEPEIDPMKPDGPIKLQ